MSNKFSLYKNFLLQNKNINAPEQPQGEAKTLNHKAFSNNYHFNLKGVIDSNKTSYNKAIGSLHYLKRNKITSQNDNSLPENGNSLPENEIEDSSKLPEDQKNCVICLGDFQDKEHIIRLPCLHVFHSDCVKSRLGTHNSCPTCKFELTFENLNAPLK